MSEQSDCTTDELNWLMELNRVRNKKPNKLSKTERDELVMSVDKWCRECAIKHQRACEASDSRDIFDRDDLYGEAIVAAIEASKDYDPETGYKFITYATSRINQRLKQFTDQRRRVRAECNVDAIAATAARRYYGDCDPCEDEGETVCQLCDGSGLQDTGGNTPWGEPINRPCECVEQERLQAAVLRQLHPLTAEIVRLFAAGCDADQIAQQLDKPVRVVQMELRNAAEVAGRIQDGWESGGELFEVGQGGEE